MIKRSREFFTSLTVFLLSCTRQSKSTFRLRRLNNFSAFHSISAAETKFPSSVSRNDIGLFSHINLLVYKFKLKLADSYQSPSWLHAHEGLLSTPHTTRLTGQTMHRSGRKVGQVLRSSWVSPESTQVTTSKAFFFLVKAIVSLFHTLYHKSGILESCSNNSAVVQKSRQPLLSQTRNWEDGWKFLKLRS